jgi:Protein of unknown function (DUF3800)
MPGTYFCFSDECGGYNQSMSTKQIISHPFYIRTTLLMNSKEWKNLNNEFRNLKIKYSLPLSKELKWSNLWSIKSYQTSPTKHPLNKEIAYLGKYDYLKLVEFVNESLSLLKILKEKKIIATYTKNSSKNKLNEKNLLKFHLQEHMQRLEMELQNNENNLGVLFIDPLNKSKDELFRNIYNELFEGGDIISNYKFIKDSLNIENSHHSVGIQITDYISGAFNSILKVSPKNDYKDGVNMFYDHVYPNLCKHPSGAIQGYGIREVPRDAEIRSWISDRLKRNKTK